MKSKTVLQFLCYSPQIYSGLDKYILLLSKKLVAQGYFPVIIFTDTIEKVPQIKIDLETIGAKVEIIPSNKLKMIVAIWRLYFKYKPLIVHIHFDNIVKLLTTFVSFLFRCRHYVSFHSTISDISFVQYKKQKGYIKSLLLLAYFRYLYTCSKHIFVISQAIKNQFLEFANIKDSSKVQVVYLGIEIKKNEQPKDYLRNYLQLPQDKILLCNISAFEYIKGIDVLCKAISLLKTQYKSQALACCHIGGLRADNESNREYRDSIYLLCKKLDIEDTMIWLGQRNDIGDVLSAFDIYVHPSRKEGLGLVNVEAAIQSLPIVGSQIGGIPEIVCEDRNGYLFESESAEQLADCLHKLIIDKDLRQKLGAESFKIAKEKFDIDLQTEKLMTYYLSE